VVIGAPAFSQPRATSVDPIPTVEQFVQRTGLRVRLTVAKASVAAFEDPGFVVHFDNVGYTLLRVNPVVTGLYIYGEDGRLAPPAASWIADVVGPAPVKNKQVVPLRPGQTLSRRVQPAYNVAYDLSRGSRYTDEPTGGRVMLRGGKYTARVVYVNAPGFPSGYHARDMPEIWEGRLESEPIAFTVAPGAEGEINVHWPPQPPGVRIEPYPATVAEAEMGLAAEDLREFAEATNFLVRLHSTSSMPALRRLLTHPEPWKRSGAAGALLGMNDERARDVAMSLIDSPDPRERSFALNWLVEHCTVAQLPLLLERLSPSSREFTTALGRCGSAESYRVLRPLLESTDEQLRRSAINAIYGLTFDGDEDSWKSLRSTPAQWDRWFDAHKGESRRTWAERQLRRNRRDAAFIPYHAVDYLRRSDDPQVLPALRRAASGTDAMVRVLAARGIAQFDRAEGVALLKRELANRDPVRSKEALTALNELTDHHYAFDFYIPAERQQAITAYAAVR
jgi:HEAT repeat protein